MNWQAGLRAKSRQCGMTLTTTLMLKRIISVLAYSDISVCELDALPLTEFMDAIIQVESKLTSEVIEKINLELEEIRKAFAGEEELKHE